MGGGAAVSHGSPELAASGLGWYTSRRERGVRRGIRHQRPAEPKPADQRAAVAHLRVRTNTEKLPAGVGSGDGNGFVEFYGSNYTAGTLDTPAGGDANKYDFNDKPVPDAVQGLGYGCLQVHDLATKTTVLAFNHFNSSTLPCDVGIGKCTGEHPDWTFARNGGAYKARRLSVWVK